MTQYTTHGRRWTQQRELARSMRKTPTAAEELLWERLRSKRLAGLKFRRQHPVGRFVVDFYCVDCGIAIEVDGPVHDSQDTEDSARQQSLEERGIRFVRFTNESVLRDIDRVLRDIVSTLAAANPPLHVVERGWPKAGGEVQEQRP